MFLEQKVKAETTQITRESFVPRRSTWSKQKTDRSILNVFQPTTVFLSAVDAQENSPDTSHQPSSRPTHSRPASGGRPIVPRNIPAVPGPAPSTFSERSGANTLAPLLFPLVRNGSRLEREEDLYIKIGFFVWSPGES